MTKFIHFKVQMSCSGCSGAITRILSKINGKLYIFIFVVILYLTFHHIKALNLLMQILKRKMLKLLVEMMSRSHKY